MKRKGTVNKSQFLFMPTNEDIKRPYTRFVVSKKVSKKGVRTR